MEGCFGRFEPLCGKDMHNPLPSGARAGQESEFRLFAVFGHVRAGRRRRRRTVAEAIGQVACRQGDTSPDGHADDGVAEPFGAVHHAKQPLCVHEQDGARRRRMEFHLRRAGLQDGLSIPPRDRAAGRFFIELQWRRAVSDFGARRAHNVDAAVYGARAAYIGGAIGTATVEAGKQFNIPLSGTMAHSWIMFFEDEYTAFKHYAETYPDSSAFLVDTYDVLQSGIPNAIRVAKEVLMPMGKRLRGVRLDSGDLAYLSKKARKMLDEAGFPDAVISASCDLDEDIILSLKRQGAQITSWGVGTRMITSFTCPSLGGVYKLAAIKDSETGEYIPKIKVSDNPEKVTNPGNKEVWRICSKDDGKIIADLISLADEKFTNEEDLLIFDPVYTWKKTLLKAGTYTIRRLLVPIYKKGFQVYESPETMAIRDFCASQLDSLWDETRRFSNPHMVYIDLSDKLYDLKKSLLDNIHKED